MISKYLVKDFIFIFSVYVSDCVCMYVPQMYVWYLQRPEQAHQTPGSWSYRQL